MSLTLAYNDLVTPDQVADQAFGKLGDAVETALRATPGSGDTEEIQQAGLRFIKAATKKVEAYLGHRLIVAQWTQRWRRDKFGCDWKEASEYARSNQTARWRAYFRQFPVVEIYSVDGSTALSDEIEIVGERMDIGIIHFDGDLSEMPADAVYFAGYIRDDQAAPGSGETWNSALLTSALTNLSATTEVDTLPQDIAAAACNIVIANMIWHLKGLVGISETEMSADRLRITSKRALDDYEMKQLESINHYRILPAW